MHLSPLQREKLISTWHDGQIAPGADWSREIEQHLGIASLILLLISPGFISSNQCYSSEMQQALERHRIGEAQVIPLLLRPVDWKGTPIGTLKALPIDTRPITTWPDRNAAFEEVAKGIRDVVNEFIAQRRLQHNRQVQDAPKNTAQKVEQEDLQEDIQSAVTWENMIQRILSSSLNSPLSNHERKIIHSFLKVMPPLELTLLLGIWRSLGETLHQKLFLTWKQLYNAERTSLLYAVEKLIDAFGYLSLEDRRGIIEIFMVGAIADPLDQMETLRSRLEKWLEITEEKRREEVDEFIDSFCL